MPIDFPESPTNGQVFEPGNKTYTWNATLGAWVKSQSSPSAPTASPMFTGTPTAPTAPADTNTTQVATTAFVVGQASATTPTMNGTAAVGTSARYARADHVHASDTSLAPLASPTFTGIPTAPTATAATNTTQIATTAFVRTEVSNLVASAPTALDTLNELATALGNDPNFATTVNTALSNRVLTTGGSTVTVSSGTTVPLTIQNNGTGNSFVVNDEASDTTPFIIDASGNVGVGTTSITSKLTVAGGIETSDGAISSTKQVAAFNWLGDIDGAKWSSKLGGFSLTFGNDGTSATALESWTFGGRTYRGYVQFTSFGDIKISGNFIGAAATNAQTGTSYTLVLSDQSKIIEMNNASANTLTVPTDASVNFPVGTVIDIFQTGAGQTTVGGAGVTINARPGLKLSGQWATATLIKRATNTWLLTGSLSA